MELSIVIPVYNEEENVEPLIQEINVAVRPLGKPYEIVVVDDRCTDKTPEIAKAKGAKVVHKVTRGGSGAGPSAAHATRIPAGHPEGYLEGFATIYSDVAELIMARLQGRDPDPEALLVPGVVDGARGVKFITAAVESSERGGAWVNASIEA